MVETGVLKIKLIKYIKHYFILWLLHIHLLHVHTDGGNYTNFVHVDNWQIQTV